MTPEPRVAFFERIGARMRAARKARGMSQGQVGRHLGVSGVAVHNWETAKHRPDLFDLRRVEALLGQEITR